MTRLVPERRPGHCRVIDKDRVGRAMAVCSGTDRSEMEAILFRRGWLGRQPPTFRAGVLDRGRLAELAAGEPVYREGDPPGGLFGIISGGIGVSAGTSKHAPRVGHVLRAGDWFGTGPILRGGSRTAGLEAIEPSCLLKVPLVALQSLAQDDPEAFRRIGALSDELLLFASNAVADLLIPWSDRRIAAVLLRVTGVDRGIEPDHPDGFALTQAQLAGMANVSRGLANMTLGRFRRAGWVEQRYNRIRVTDAEALSAFAYHEE